MREELNNYPRTKYLARVRNPHPDLIDRDDRNSVRGHGKAEDGHQDQGHGAKAEKAAADASHAEPSPAETHAEVDH